MKDYEKKVKKHYDSMSSSEIDNGSIEHAKIVVKYLFKMAEEKKLDVKIATGCLDGAFYSNFTESAKNILKNNKISIISHDEPDESIFKTLISESENASLLTAGNKVMSLPHFILVGDKAYRIEEDNMLMTARASFNRESIGSFLASFFGDIKKAVA